MKDIKSQLDSKTKAYTELESKLQDTSSQLTTKTKAYTGLEFKLLCANNKAQQAEANANAQKEQSRQDWDTELQKVNTLRRQHMDAAHNAKSNVEHDLVTERQNFANYESQVAEEHKNWQSERTQMQCFIGKPQAEIAAKDTQIAAKDAQHQQDLNQAT